MGVQIQFTRHFKRNGINIVLPYRLAHDGIELKYALRSIEKYLTGFKDVYLVTDSPPKWYKGKVIHCFEESAKTSLNILNKLIKAGSVREVGETFVQWQDDIFLLKPLDVKDIKYWYDGTIEQAEEKARGKYKRYVINTGMLIGGVSLYFDTHAPIVYSTTYLKHIHSLVADKPRLIKSIYCNEAGDAAEYEEMSDCKFSEPYTLDIKDQIKDKLFFSIGPGVDDTIAGILEELFPTKSKWE